MHANMASRRDLEFVQEGRALCLDMMLLKV